MAIVCIIQYEVKLVFDIYSIFSLAKKKNLQSFVNCSKSSCWWEFNLKKIYFRFHFLLEVLKRNSRVDNVMLGGSHHPKSFQS